MSTFAAELGKLDLAGLSGSTRGAAF
jgi:hypothetical protein